MRLNVDLNSLQLIAALNDRREITRIDAKRRDGLPLDIGFSRDGILESIGSPFVLTFICKEKDDFGGGAVVLEQSFSYDSETKLYSAAPSLNTSELGALFASEPAFVDLSAELSWAIDGGLPVSIKTFTFRVANDVYQGDEGTPDELPTPEESWAQIDLSNVTPATGRAALQVPAFLSAITGYIGGTSSDLDSVATTALSAGALVQFREAVDGTLESYRLKAGTDAESSPTIIRPDDYNASTNAKVWERVTAALPSTISGVFELSDGTGTVIPANQIAGVNGLPAVGDGSTLEGKLLSPRIIDISQQIAAATLVSGGVVKLADIPVSAERMTNLSTLWLELEMLAGFSSTGHNSQLLFHLGFSGYSGWSLPSTLGGTNDQGTSAVELGVTSSKAAGYFIEALVPLKITLTAATPPFVPDPHYIIRQVADAGGSAAKAMHRELTEAPGFDFKGWVNDGSTAVGPTTAQDCQISLFLGVAADAGNGSRTLNLDGRIKAWW